MSTTKQQREAEFHDRSFSESFREHVSGFYAITRSSAEYFWSLVESEKPAGKHVLELGCGVSAQAFRLARLGATVTGVDISPVAIEQVRRRARQEGIEDRAEFRVMDGEALAFDDDTFDLVCGSAIIHHLDAGKAYSEVARVLRPDGAGVFVEPLGHNPLINWYRNRSPRLRTSDEHPLLMPELELAKERFGLVDARFFYLTSLMAIPFRSQRFFSELVQRLDALDRQLFSIVPASRRYAWQTVFRVAERR